jgi:Flp pilus assembly protein CpaB
MARLKKRGSTLFLVAAVLFAAMAAFLATKTVKSFNETSLAVVAVKDIEPFVQITKEDIKLTEVPSAAVPTDAIVKVDALVGKYLKSPAYKGDVIREIRIADIKGDRGLMSAQISELGRPDLRAFALPYTGDNGVGGEIQAGDRIDIVASVKMDSPNGQVGCGKIVGCNVLVLQAEPGEQNSAGTLIVALAPQQIEDIAFALTSGQVRFALNPYRTDEQAAETTGVTSQDWLTKYGFSGNASSQEQTAETQEQ